MKVPYENAMGLIDLLGRNIRRLAPTVVVEVSQVWPAESSRLSFLSFLEIYAAGPCSVHGQRHRDANEGPFSFSH